MIGAIIGDIIGSYYEHNPTKDYHFTAFTNGSDFTDDTVLTIATADAVLNRKPYKNSYLTWARNFPERGYGGNFREWIKQENPQPYNSFGNGSAMRISPVGFIGKNQRHVLEEAEKSARVSHDHPEGIKGAQATALAIFLAFHDHDKKFIKETLENQFGYQLSREYSSFQPQYKFDVSCQGSVPEAIIAFLESEDYESAIRLAVALGGDADTQAAIAGGIAEAFYHEIPAEWRIKALDILPEEINRVIDQFYEKLVG